MAELGKISPNRMELLKNKRRLVLATRGHKLLKDKYDELIRRFLLFIKEGQELRKISEFEILKLYKIFTLVRAELPIKSLLPLLEQKQLNVSLKIDFNNLLNTKVPNIEKTFTNEKKTLLSETPLAYDVFLEKLKTTTDLLISLAQHEQTIRILANEIDKTRRRVNALEHVLIPSLSQNIRFISMKMDELDRENRTRLMKTKEILMKSAI